MHRTLGKRRFAGIAAAFAVPLAGLVVAATAENPARASEAELERNFDRAFVEASRPASASVGTAANLLDAASPAATEPEPQDTFRAIGDGVASYYGRRFAGRPTANGEVFDPSELTAAHRTLPFGSMVRVTNPRNGREVTVRINDRGPFHGNRIIDLSRKAAQKIGLVQRGKGMVNLALLED